MVILPLASPVLIRLYAFPPLSPVWRRILVPYHECSRGSLLQHPFLRTCPTLLFHLKWQCWKKKCIIHAALITLKIWLCVYIINASQGKAKRAGALMPGNPPDFECANLSQFKLCWELLVYFYLFFFNAGLSLSFQIFSFVVCWSSLSSLKSVFCPLQHSQLWLGLSRINVLAFFCEIYLRALQFFCKYVSVC